MSAGDSRDLRTEILSAATRLFIRRGYHGLSMREIAEAVGVSKSALYYHFEDKEELLLAILGRSLEQVRAVIEVTLAQGEDFRERIRLFVEGILSQPVEQRAVIRLASQEMSQLSPVARQAFNRTYHEAFIHKIREMIAEGIRRGEVRPLDPDVGVWTLLGMMYPYFYPVHAEDVPLPVDVAEQIVSIYLDGVNR